MLVQSTLKELLKTIHMDYVMLRTKKHTILTSLVDLLQPRFTFLGCGLFCASRLSHWVIQHNLRTLLHPYSILTINEAQTLSALKQAGREALHLITVYPEMQNYISVLIAGDCTKAEAKRKLWPGQDRFTYTRICGRWLTCSHKGGSCSCYCQNFQISDFWIRKGKFCLWCSWQEQVYDELNWPHRACPQCLYSASHHYLKKNNAMVNW